MKNKIYGKGLVFITVFVLISFEITLGISCNSSIFIDNFNDGDISDWTITTNGNGIFETSTTKYVSSPYSAHMKSLNQYDQAMAVSPSYSLNISEDYNISFYFLIPSTNNHWFEVFNNHQTYLLIDSNTQLKWYDGTSSHSIISLTTNQWYYIEMDAQPSLDIYDIYINSQYKTTCDIWLHSGFENSFRIGDRNNDQGSYFDYGEAYWDDFEISQCINNPPNTPATPDGPTSGIRYTLYEYSTSTTDPEGDQLYYLWNWDDGSSPVWYGPYSSGETCTQSHEWTDLGIYDIKVKAKDQYNEESDWSNPTVLTISNVPPVADPNGPYIAECHEPLQLDGSGSADPDGEINEYFWDLGDGNTATGPYPTHTYPVEGEYVINLTVTDNDGDTDSETTTATVIDPEVYVDAGGPYFGETGNPIQFTGSAEGGTLPYSWFWDFDDGNTSDEQNPTHGFNQPGEYNIMLSVVDSQGKIGWDIAEVTIESDPFSVDINGPYRGKINEPIQFECSVIGGTQPYSYLWSFGDNCSSTEKNPIHQYTSEKTYDATIIVTDAEIETARDNTTVVITEEINHAPETPIIDGPQHGKEGLKYIYTATTTDPDDDQIFYIWNFSDSSELIETLIPLDSGEICKLDHTFTEKGDYTLRVKARDIYDAESDWSEPLEISIPKIKIYNPLQYLLRLLERFPFMVKILNQIIL